jgi:hypothetical protein
LILKELANDGEKQMFYCPINEENLEKCPGWENRHNCYPLPHQDLCVLLKAEFDVATKTFDVMISKERLENISNTIHKQIVNDAVIEE